MPTILIPALDLGESLIAYVQARRSGVELEVVPIRTLYFDRNSGSRFRTVADSLRIAALIGHDLVQHMGTHTRRPAPAALRRETP